MLAFVESAAIIGVDAYQVTVEVDATRGLPRWMIVGLAANAVKESLQRVSAAITNSGFEVPPRRVTVNLAPADERKDGTGFDLPIALAVLVAVGHLTPAQVQGIVALGELGLDGSVRAVRGILPVARRLASLTPRRPLVVPPANAWEAQLLDGQEVWTPATLRSLVEALRRAPAARAALLAPRPNDYGGGGDVGEEADLSDVAGQETAKRALEIAAAGGHALLFVGSPGAGKTMLARRLPGILPPLSTVEALEVLAIQSVAGALPPGAAAAVLRPFRAPHHSLSTAALIGGGSVPRPGEVSLAHHGVLFLDELQEMPRSRLDVLRQPMEDGRVLIARAQQSVMFPAQFALVGAMNPCPCGFAGDPSRACSCAAADVVKHRSRVSGPLADRIDLTVTVPALPVASLVSRAGESSAQVRDRVVAARMRQQQRFVSLSGVRCNARAGGRWIDAHTPISADARRLLVRAAEQAGLSARGFHRVLKVSRTIADLADAEGVERSHVSEALFFRAGERVPRASGAA